MRWKELLHLHCSQQLWQKQRGPLKSLHCLQSVVSHRSQKSLNWWWDMHIQRKKQAYDGCNTASCSHFRKALSEALLEPWRSTGGEQRAPEAGPELRQGTSGLHRARWVGEGRRWVGRGVSFPTYSSFPLGLERNNTARSGQAKASLSATLTLTPVVRGRAHPGTATDAASAQG